MMEITTVNNIKRLFSPEVNYVFNKDNGISVVWGKTVDDDPEYSPWGPFIADIEITTICSGINNIPCPFCYKSNTTSGHNMSLETFKKIFDKLPKTLQQIAFGVDSKCESNPDTFKIFEYCRENGVIPNVTVADVSVETAKKLAALCGAVSVSVYDDYNVCYDSVKRLTDAGLKQVNLHQMISKQTLKNTIRTLHDIQSDDRLKNMNAIIFLSLKKVGRGKHFDTVSQEDYNALVQYCLMQKIKFGFDSCGCAKFLEAVKDHPEYKRFEMLAEPCESTRFSSYINVHGRFSACSFLDDNITGATKGIDVVNCNDFMNDVWFDAQTVAFRKKSIECMKNCGGCPVYEV